MPATHLPSKAPCRCVALVTQAIIPYVSCSFSKQVLTQLD